MQNANPVPEGSHVSRSDLPPSECLPSRAVRHCASSSSVICSPVCDKVKQASWVTVSLAQKTEDNSNKNDVQTKKGSLEGHLASLRHGPHHRSEHMIPTQENVDPKENGSPILHAFGAKMPIKGRESDADGSLGYVALAGA